MVGGGVEEVGVMLQGRKSEVELALLDALGMCAAERSPSRPLERTWRNHTRHE